MSQRVQFIDRLKGFAILSVILGHLCMWQLGGYNTPTWFVNTFHMPVFLFLSGFVVTPPNLLKLVKKLMRFLIPGLVVGSAFVFYKNFDIVSFLYHDSKFGYWYLFVLSGYYILMMLFHYVNTYIGKKALLLISL